MAAQSAQDVVSQSQSVGDFSPADAPATTTNGDIGPSRVDDKTAAENGLHRLAPAKMDDFEDGSGRSDNESAEAKAVKKFAAARPVSFAKYSVPKVIAASTANTANIKPADRSSTPTSVTTALQPLGRPRLVAKTTSSQHQKAQAARPAAPDPMQVWNKNRAVTPQPSTKHLTDEELKQQYGIHLTSRLQTDADAKEANGAQKAAAGAHPGQATADNLQPGPPPPPQFASSVGPNATVLKLGANAERQQAQKAAANDKTKGNDKTASLRARAAPAPAPSKSPWAALPPVDKVSPVAINPPPRSGPVSHYSSGLPLDTVTPQPGTTPAAAPEMSADDFSRSWKDSPTNQPRELFMPSSGRYEAVPPSDSRRRLSKNDHAFRAPALLQRPAQASDNHAPAEPSAAFQTSRTSHDLGRRRASSIVSGSSGPLARRLSIKSGDASQSVFSLQDSAARPTSSQGPASRVQTPSSQQPHGPAHDYVPSAIAPAAPPMDIEAEREKQKIAMKEKIEAARQRKQEEEARLEAEKRERIAKRLAALPPLPVKADASKKAEAEVHEQQSVDRKKDMNKGREPVDRRDTTKAREHGADAKEPSRAEAREHADHKDPTSDSAKPSSVSRSRPKPPQPLATGEPQQYGLMKVHPLDAPSPRLSRPDTTTSRGGWADLRDHRSPASGNLWGTSSNKALGNGTFDHGLAGYAPQDLSRASSTAQGWMSGRTPVGGRSPQQYAPPSLQPPLASPDQTPLAADSEADPLFPTVRPAPIAPPHAQQSRAMPNGLSPSAPPHGNLAAWTNFHTVAAQQDRAENERYQRELAAKRDDELRTGVRPARWYGFNETWKQVHLGDQANQRHLTAVHQSSLPPPAAATGPFGPLGTATATDPPSSPRLVNAQPARGSRFFPASQPNGQQDRRAVTYSHSPPSPPPAEDYASYHPVFDGDFHHPTVKLPREKPVVKLPSAEPVEPAAASPAKPVVKAAPPPPQPMSWAAKRAVSTPIVDNHYWQERFNGLLGKKPSQKDALTTTPSAIAPVTREPLDVLPLNRAAAVSMPKESANQLSQAQVDDLSTKDVEDEVDLFEDRELASLPVIALPTADLLPLPLAAHPRKISPAVDSSTIGYLVLTNNPVARQFRNEDKPQYVLVRMPTSAKSVKRDLPNAAAPAGGPGPQAVVQQKSRSPPRTTPARRTRGSRPRQASKAQSNLWQDVPAIDEADTFSELVDKLAIYISRTIDAAYTYDQLRTSIVGQSLRPLIVSLVEECHNPAVVAALMAQAYLYRANDNHDAGLSQSRALACELVGWQLLTFLSQKDLIDFLLYELPPQANAKPDDTLPRHRSMASLDGDDNDDDEARPLLQRRPTRYAPLDPPRPLTVDLTHDAAQGQGQGQGQPAVGPDSLPYLLAGLNALEIAAIADAKKFLSQAPVQAIVQDIWHGHVIFWESLSVHAVKKARVFNPHLADPFTRLRVPKYQKAFQIAFFLTFLVLYYSVLIKRTPYHVDPLEFLLDIWILAFGYDELGEILDAGLIFYQTDFWSLWDVCIILVGVAFMATRLTGLAKHSDYLINLSFDILSLVALFLVPRIFSIFSLNPYFGSLIPVLKEMTKTFCKFLPVIAVLYLGFLTTFSMLARERLTLSEMSLILVKVFFGSSYLGFDVAVTASALNKTAVRSVTHSAIPAPGESALVATQTADLIALVQTLSTKVDHLTAIAAARQHQPNSQSLAEAASLYSQYGSGYAQTCPLPQAQSPFPHILYSNHSRPKSMSWPRGMFSAPTTTGAVWEQSPAAVSPFFQECQYQQVPDSFADPAVSISPTRPGYVSISDDSELAAVPPYEFGAVSGVHAAGGVCQDLVCDRADRDDLAQSPDTSSPKNSSVTSPSSMQDTSLHSTPVSVSTSLHSLPAQPGLLGLNCQFAEPAGLPVVPWGGAAARPNLGLCQPQPGSQLREKKRRSSAQQPKRSFACDFCDMKFDRKSNLKDHNRTHGVGKRCVPCHFPGCKKFYGRKADVNRHVRSFHQKDSVSCEHCHKTFLRSDSLTRHNVDNCRHQKDADANAARDSSRWHHRPRSEDEIGRLIAKTEA
ncbi:hypothetical protein DV738_g4701, partial [Chaetothyriales sp. CBS 135597]